MPNAKDVTSQELSEKFLVLGQTGAGKTTQFLTLPGKKFMYLFDPNALLSLRGHDIEFEQFLPDILNLDIASLSKDKNGNAIRRKIMQNNSADVYTAWEKDVDERIADGYFDQFDWIGFDSFTTLSSMVMDSVLQLNGRAGMWPGQDDYGPQMNSLTKIVRTFTGALHKKVYFTGHIEMVKDKLAERIYYQPLMTGRLRATLPLLFSEILHLQADSDSSRNVNYTCHFTPSRQVPLIRNTLDNVDPIEDITLDWTKDPILQGLGGLYYGKEKTA